MNTLLKTYFILSLNIIPLFALNAQSSAGSETRKILFSIGSYEKPVQNGSSISLSPIGNTVTVITSDEAGRIYVYENGFRRGPYKDVNDTKITLPDSDYEEFNPIFKKESDTGYEKYSEYNGEGEVFIKFGGKSFGPFQFILEFYPTNDNSAFSAIVMKGGKPQIVTSSGKAIDLDGQPGYNHISASGKKMMVVTVKEDETNQNKPPEAFIWFQDGKKYGPFDPAKTNETNPAYCKSGGENWLLTMNSKLFINGIAVKDLSNDYISPANIWISEDGKKYVIVVYNRIEFSDGKVFRDPLKVRIALDRNRVTLWWLLLENEKDIVLYSKTI